MGHFHVIIDAASSNSKMFEFYYFIKDFREEMACDRPPQTCRISNFLVTLERVFSDEKKCCEEKRNVFIKPCIKKNQLVFHSMYQRYNKKDQVFLTIHRLKETRE